MCARRHYLASRRVKKDWKGSAAGEGLHPTEESHSLSGCLKKQVRISELRTGAKECVSE